MITVGKSLCALPLPLQQSLLGPDLPWWLYHPFLLQDRGTVPPPPQGSAALVLAFSQLMSVITVCGCNDLRGKVEARGGLLRAVCLWTLCPYCPEGLHGGGNLLG